MQQHDGVSTAHAYVTTGSELCLFFFGEALTGIGAHQEPVGSGGFGHLLGRSGLDAGQARVRPQGKHEGENE